MSKNEYLVRAGKLVTASEDFGTLYDGAFAVEDGKIIDVDKYSTLKDKYPNFKILNYKNYTVTPSLVDCHTHLLEYAPPALFPVTEATHLMGDLS